MELATPQTFGEEPNAQLRMTLQRPPLASIAVASDRGGSLASELEQRAKVAVVQSCKGGLAAPVGTCGGDQAAGVEEQTPENEFFERIQYK